MVCDDESVIAVGHAGHECIACRSRCGLPSKRDTCVSSVNEPTSEALTRLCRSTDRALWASHTASLGVSGALGMRFPSRKPPAAVPLRISEQEARHLFCSLAPEHGFSYNLETPTENTFKQSGAKATRARFDASLLDEHGERLWNVEFKTGGFSAKSTSKVISKDLEKLLVDPGAGAWFHLLERINNGTISSLIERIRTDVQLVCNQYCIDPQQQLVIHVCVLQPGFSVHRTISVGELLDGSTDLQLSHHVSVGQLTAIEPGDWLVLEKESDA